MSNFYEVSYYEHGLTNRINRRFFFAISATICALVARIKYGKESYIRVYSYEKE